VSKLRAESARAGRPAPHEASARPGSAARPRPEARPKPARPAARDEDDGEDEIEETWLPGGGFLESEGEEGAPAAERGARSAGRRPSEWPARAGERRGDDGFRPGDSRPASRAAHGQGPRRERQPRESPRGEGPRGERQPREGPRREGPRREGARRDRPPARGQGRGRVAESRGGGRTRGGFAESRTRGGQRRVGTRNPSRRKPR